MARPWQRQSFGPTWRGLLDRRQVMVDDPLFARVAENVEFYGGPIAKRSGSQLITGWGSYVTVEAVNTMDVTVYSTGPGGVNGGFIVGEGVTLVAPDGNTGFATIAAVDPGLSRVSFTTPVTLPVGSAIYATRPVPGGNPIRCLVQPTFRDGTTQMIVASGGAWFKVTADAAPTPIPELYATTTVNTWVSSTVIDVETAEGFEVGDRIAIIGAGVAGADLIATILKIVYATGIGFPFGEITFTPAASTQPPATRVVVFPPVPDPSLDQFAVLFANTLHLASAPLNPSTFYIPKKYLMQTGAIYRHGILGPHFIDASLQSGTGNFGSNDQLFPPIGVYGYTFTYYNPLTGQESVSGHDLRPFGTKGFTVFGSDPVAIGLNDSAFLTFFGSADPQVTLVRIYRTDAGGSEFFRIAEIPNVPDQMTFVDKGLLSSGVSLRLGLDYPVLPQVTQWFTWPQASRLIGIVPARKEVLTGNLLPGFLVFSDQPDLTSGFFKGESFPPNNQIFISYDDGDDLVTGAAFVDSLIIFKHHSVWRIEGIPPDIVINPVHFAPGLTGLGLVAPKLVIQDHDEILFPAFDGYHLLARYAGVNSGFESQRISLPIDSRFLAIQPNDRPKGHAVFFRGKRQLRAWLDFEQALVFQFAGDAEGGAAGWATWALRSTQDESQAVAVTSSLVAPSHVGITTDSARPVLPDQMCYIGTDTGLILQLDWGTADFGGFAYTVQYETTEFAPGERGRTSRGRALDLQMSVYSPTPPDLTFKVDTDQLVTPITTLISPSANDAQESPFDLLRIGTSVPLKLGALLLATGLYHRLSFTERGVATLYRFLGWDYWWQTLVEQATSRTFRATTLETLQ